jgi:O-succinylbenzoic acid--CoA ligase
MLSFANHQASTLGMTTRLGLTDADRWLLCMPLYHIGGQSILLRAAQYGIPVILQDGFEATETYHLLHDEAVTFVSLVPTMLSRLLPFFAHDGVPESLRIILLGGAAAAPELITTSHDLRLPIALTYGLTEACSQVATATPAEVHAKPGTVGKALHGTEIRIDAEAGEIGEILVKGATVMSGYYQQPDATAETLRENWLHTGDLGYQDADGDLFIVNRRTDLIVSGGENVYPSEVEAALTEHPAVVEACVIGLPHPDWGQQVGAALIVNQPISGEELTAFCRTKLAGFKIPRQYRFVETYPRTASGKIIRQAMQHQFLEERAAMPIQR